jgi:hypothetical protein
MGKDTAGAVRIQLLSSSLRRFLGIIQVFATGFHTGCFSAVSAKKNTIKSTFHHHHSHVLKKTNWKFCAISLVHCISCNLP